MTKNTIKIWKRTNEVTISVTRKSNGNNIEVKNKPICITVIKNSSYVSFEKSNDTPITITSNRVCTEKLNDLPIHAISNHVSPEKPADMFFHVVSANPIPIIPAETLSDAGIEKSNDSPIHVVSANPIRIIAIETSGNADAKQLIEYQRLKDELILTSNTEKPDRKKMKNLRANIEYYEKRLGLPNK
jgi:hypothetical protein